MNLDILTPEKRIFGGEVEEINLPTRTGYITILSGHTPLVSAVQAGNIRIKTVTGERVFISERGVLQTANNKTVLLLRKCTEK